MSQFFVYFECQMLVDYFDFFDIYFVGWFDVDSEGLLLFIDDGKLQYVIVYLCCKQFKIYLVQVEGLVMLDVLQCLCNLLDLGDFVI